MSVKLKITVTKEILEKSKMCGFNKESRSENCAIALAVRDVFPKAVVGREVIFTGYRPDDRIKLPKRAVDFIDKFDSGAPYLRIIMPVLQFEINIPDHIINQINIDELKPLLVNHPTLQLVE